MAVAHDFWQNFVSIYPSCGFEHCCKTCNFQTEIASNGELEGLPFEYLWFLQGCGSLKVLHIGMSEKCLVCQIIESSIDIKLSGLERTYLYFINYLVN